MSDIHKQRTAPNRDEKRFLILFWVIVACCAVLALSGFFFWKKTAIAQDKLQYVGGEFAKLEQGFLRLSSQPDGLSAPGADAGVGLFALINRAVAGSGLDSGMVSVRSFGAAQGQKESCLVRFAANDPVKVLDFFKILSGKGVGELEVVAGLERIDVNVKIFEK